MPASVPWKYLTRCAYLILPGILGFAACRIDEPPYDRADGGKGKGSTPGAVDGVCGETELEAQDPATLPPCECAAGGAARCVAAEKMPAALSSQLQKCDGDKGACVPDTVIANGPKPLPTCKANGKDGRCLSMCVPLVAKYAESILKRGDGDTCPTDERCVPCENPLDGTSTGICDIDEPSSAPCEDGDAGVGIGVAPNEPITCPFSGTPADPNRFPTCNRGGRCIDANLIADPRIKARLEPCAQGLCVPEVYVTEKGQHLPKACSSFAGSEGRCFSMVFKDVFDQRELLKQDVCADDERCLPCFIPSTGEPTGACATVSCDSTKMAPPNLKSCCSKQGELRGKCIPKTDIPEKFLSRVERYECQTTEICAPSDNLNPNIKPVTCAAPRGQGVCVSDCIKFKLLEKIVLDQANCRSDQTCVPCKHPTTGEETGAPGCP